MGATISNELEIEGSSMGYQVLRVHPNSPGSRAGLKAYFDFIVAIGNTRFNKEDGSLREILKASADVKLKMVVYNTRTKKTREVEIAPSTNWGGNGLLGVSIKHSSFDRAEERVWHVVEVEPGSPAQQAGFIAGEDYVIGSDSILQENDDLYNLVEAHEGKALKLFLYNIRTDNCRDVICHPNSRWGGRGYLGCEFGHGLLHRIPYGGSSDNINNNPRASLLRNEQPVATQQIDQNYINFSLQRALAQQQQLRQPRPQPDTVSMSKSQPESQPAPLPESQPEPKPEPQAEFQPGFQAVLQPGFQAVFQSDLQPKTQPEPQPIVQPEAQLQSLFQPQTQLQQQSQPQPQAQLQPLFQPQFQAQFQPQTQVLPPTQIQPPAQVQPQTQFQPEAQFQPQTQFQPHLQSQGQLQLPAQVQPQTQAQPQTQVQPQAQGQGPPPAQPPPPPEPQPDPQAPKTFAQLASAQYQLPV